ncbi:kinesin-domain-containing protein [Aulographum hederae CBS 113979]|uniref:Kinesin-like protein n=1 Tax=Aulographum hederae CBS 113979 TaxID=1176131 RepID=A0A6G1GN91_9PEZI|nr:kinesin-domain-containing protein [Aulographum hederae CBS 113979]
MALDHRLYGYQSNASAPSLRAPEPLPSPTLTLDSSVNTPDSANVKVVVRVRQFVKREIERNAQCIIKMDPETQTTTLLSPSGGDASSRARKEEKSFVFDKSFWSHDANAAHYAQQEDIFASFGSEFLDHNFDGYHTCIFAYGQTGSGKSYTMMGTPQQPGLIPRTCEELFDRIRREGDQNTTYNVHVSYFEVYNEHVRDLLVPKRAGEPLYLKIRESQTDGVYVQGLTDSPVKCYEDIERLMQIGDLNRTTASTKMNDTSSRSHAVFTLTLKQIQHSLSNDETVERTARMRLVDLAGSERAKSTEATGQRLVEGGKINKSLSTLGRVIAALANDGNQQKGRNNRREKVPYRDSVLTWLLRDSLGGNSKTAMVACISPVDYDETLSTLRYADQAKRIRTRAHANIDARSAAERDAQIQSMQETIRVLQSTILSSRNERSERVKREREEGERELEDYQKEVGKMHRLMEETQLVSDNKIRHLTAEVEILRPTLAKLGLENETLKRHLSLLVGELKNPIVLPTLDDEAKDFDVHEDEDDSEDDSGYDESEVTDNLAEELQAEAAHIIEQLNLFRRRVGDDHLRFGNVNTIAEMDESAVSQA